LVGGDTTSLSNRIDLRLKIADTTNMLSPYWRSGRFSGTLPVANGGTNLTSFTNNGVLYASSTSALATSPALTFDGGEFTFTRSIAPFFRSTESSTGITSYFGSYSVGLYLGTTTNHPIQFIQKTFEKMRLDSIGLGIGTSSPSSRLHVKGVDGTSSNSSLNVTNSSNTSLLFVRNDGNIGIGTTSPSYKLDIAQSSDSYYAINISNPSARNAAIGYSSTYQLDLGATGTNDNVRYGVFTSGGGVASFYTSSYERMRITSGGNILMNTVAAPTTGGFTNTTLSVKQVADGLSGGGLHIEENATTSVAYFGFNGSVFNIGTSYRTTGNFRPITFSTNGYERLRIDNNGNVGIGTTSPIGKLHIYGDESASLKTYSGLGNTGGGDGIINVYRLGGVDNYLRLLDIVALGDDLNTRASVIRFLTTNTSNVNSEKVRIDGNGNVGIGTASPQTKLQVANSSSAILLTESSSVATIIGTNAAGTASQGLSLRGFPLTFTGNGGVGSEAMRITSAGNVLIGTDADSGYKLNVNGTFSATGAATFSSSVTAQSGTFNTPTLSGSVTTSINSQPVTTSHYINHRLGNAFITGRGTTGETFISSNTDLFTATITGASSYLTQNVGSIRFLNAASVSAGTTPSFVERFSINTTGAVTISNLASGTVTSSSGTLSATSDMNLKISDGYIDNALDKIMNLKPRYFYWKEETGLPTNIRQLGFYAQEVNQALGEEASNTPKNENDKWGIYDRGIIAMLTKAIQEQQLIIKALEQEIINLKNK
jgi:hypothetical protein